MGRAPDRLIQDPPPARRAGRNRLQWGAGVAAVVIAAIAVTTFVLAKAGNHPQALTRTTPSPSAQENTLSVPDSTPLILYRDPVKSDQLDGVTWDGKTSGKLSYQHFAGLGNPQNNLFAGSTEVVDRSGKTVMSGTFGAKFFGGRWADDGVHFCQAVPFDNPGGGGLQTTLQLVSVGQGTRDVARVGTLYNQTSVRVAACSVLADRAVVVQSGGQGIGTAQLWAVQLSSGKVIWTHAHDAATEHVTVVASRDGMYVAENLVPSGETTVYGPDGKAAARLPYQVEAFSWDDTLAVVDSGYGSTPVDVVSWRAGTVLWSCPPGTALMQALPEPGGAELALWVAPTTEFQQQTQFPDLYVLGADGSVIFHVARTGGP